MTPVALHLRRGTLQPPDLATYRFGPSLSAPLACLCLRRLRRFTWVGHTTRPWSPTAAVLAVAISARAPIATLAGEDALSRGLRTPPLSATHASVGDCWQNSRCRHLLLEAGRATHFSRYPRVARKRTRNNAKSLSGNNLDIAVPFGTFTGWSIRPSLTW